MREYIENLESELKSQKNTKEQLERTITQQDEKIAQQAQEIENLQSELHRAQQKNAELQSKMEYDFKILLEQEIAKRDEEWEEYLDERLAERDEYWQQQIAKLKNQNELPTNAQNDSSNVIHRKK